jgi:carbon storage regulator CsrA
MLNLEKGGSTMLVLSRKSRESVVIGGSNGLHCLVKVTVLDIRGTNVKLGFEADSDVAVHRTEVWEQICASGQMKTESGTGGRFAT